MRPKANDFCKTTNKVRYSSEAKAIRSVNSYEDIKRAYYCSHCDGFHITSKSKAETLEFGELSLEEENKLLRQLNNELDKKVKRLAKRNRYQANQIEKLNNKQQTKNQ